MTTKFTQNCPDDLPERLAAAAGAGDLAAAAAIDAEEGDKFLHTLLADQMAATHLLTMRMAGAADRAIAAAGAGGGDDNLPLFDLAAARFAGTAARLNGRYCRGLQTLRTLAALTAEEEVEWQGVRFIDDPELSPEESARRINRLKFHMARDRTEPQREPNPRRRRIDAAEQARLAAAQNAARDLVAATGVSSLAHPSNAQRATLFTHQLAAAHRLMMRLSGRADAVVTASAEPLDRPESLRLAHGAARLMERFRQGVTMLNRMRSGPDTPRRTEYYLARPLSDEEREQERLEDIAAGLDPDTGLPADASAANLPASAPPATTDGPARGSFSGGGLLRRGRLNNGNPGGDFLAAPRCGARTRGSCSCRQPAMANGRCRFHGGKSTGPRSEAGRARARSNRLVHGLRSADVIALSGAAAAAHRRLGALLGASAGRVHRKGHTDRIDPQEMKHTSVSPRRKPGSIFQRPESMNPGFRRGDTHGLTQSEREAPAGHGVDRSESNTAAGSATILPFRRPTPARSPCRSRLPRVRS
ncbi:MAG TPA: HGGxSTG domain-containing protein [Candidatus Angelobacter sp.]|nr:HGGxSTG domain-containing protein [Candidatus Angelobacter sp.]